MGSCLTKSRKNKRNTVAPAPEGDVCEIPEGDICERLSRATLRPGSSSGSPVDMAKNLQESQFEDPKMYTAGDALALDVKDGKPALDVACAPVLKEGQVHYSAEEQELMDALYIIVLDKLRKRTEKARMDVNIARKLTAIPKERKIGEKKNI